MSNSISVPPPALVARPSQPPPIAPPLGALRFDKAEAIGGVQTLAACASCRRDVGAIYYEINGKMACASCHDEVRRRQEEGATWSGFARAAALGSLAALAGAIVYGAIGALTGHEFALVAIAIGFGVGLAVRKGSGNAGGRRYQVLAAFLTYSAIVFASAPMLLQALAKHAHESPPATHSSGPFGLVFGMMALVGLLYAAPLLAGVKNFIGWLIIGFGVYEAWKLNRPAMLSITGPHRRAAQPAGVTASPPQHAS